MSSRQDAGKAQLDAIHAHLDEHARVASQVSDTLRPAIDAYATRALETVRAGRTIFFCGNGGSAADAQHLAAEYVVRFVRARSPAAAIALTTDTSIITAAANDLGFASVFERQIAALGRDGDLLVLHSTSGESANLLRAADAARGAGVRTVALLAKGGGPLAARVDQALVVPTDSTARAQEMHLLIGHIVCAIVDEAMA
jgi:D-sedoheptulose 7-phosphate isomerase